MLCVNCREKIKDDEAHLCEDEITKAAEYLEDAYNAWAERTEGSRRLWDAATDRMLDERKGA